MLEPVIVPSQLLCWSERSVFIPTDPCSPTAVLQCSEAQKLLNITKELLHTEEAYVKRLNLLDQVRSGPRRRPLGRSWRWNLTICPSALLHISISCMCQRF